MGCSLNATLLAVVVLGCGRPHCLIASLPHCLIGPWHVKAEHFIGKFYASICVVTTTNLVEFTCIESKGGNVIAQKLEQSWLVCYPRPIQVVNDNGGALKGYTFACLIRTFWIKHVQTTSKNPQSNAVYKQIYKTMVMMLKMLLLVCPLQTWQDILHLVDESLPTTILLRSTISAVLKAKPGALVITKTCSSMFPLLQNDKPLLATKILMWMVHY